MTPNSPRSTCECCVLPANSRCPVPTLSAKGVPGPVLPPCTDTRHKAQHALCSINISWAHKGNLNTGRRSQKNHFWGAGGCLKRQGWLTLSPETPPTPPHPPTQCPSAGWGWPQAQAVAAFSPPPTFSTSLGPTSEGRKLMFIEGLLWAVH